VSHIPTCASVNIPQSWKDWYHAKPSQICYVQDTVHTAVKLKSRLLKPQIVLPLGSFHASSSHLLALRLTLQKDQHGLHQKDIDHKDKQNFQAVVNITNAGHLLD